MGWKNWSYTKRGFVIALIYLTYSLIIQFTIFEKLFMNQLNESLIFNILGILQWPLILGGSIPLIILTYGLNMGEPSKTLLYFSSSIVLLLIGTLIGFIVGKIKSSSSKS